MNILVAVDADWGIGLKGDLLFKISEDMQNFKSLTENNVVIMGNNTLKSLPGSKCLKNRTNIILSHDVNLRVPNGIVYHSIPQLMNEVVKIEDKEIFVIGGQEIYEQLLSYCSQAYVTKVRKQCDADKIFPNLDVLPEWEMVYESEIKEDKGIIYTFNRYVNHAVLKD